MNAPNWQEVARLALPRNSSESISPPPRLFILWGELRELCFEETLENEVFLHFRQTESCPTKSCLKKGSPLLYEIPPDLLPEALEVLLLQSASLEVTLKSDEDFT